MSKFCINKKLNKDIYSAEEIKTNKVYIDKNGKEWPIYIREFSGKLASSGSSTLISKLDNNMLIRETYGEIYVDAGIGLLNIGSYLNNSYYSAVYSYNNNLQLHYANNNGFWNCNFLLIIEYIKTTD